MNSVNHTYCRLCAVFTANIDIINLRSKYTKCSEINKKLERINAFTDFNDDTLPKTVCLTCVNSLDVAYEFVLKIEQAQHELRSIYICQSFKSEIDEDKHVLLKFDHQDSVEDYEPIESAPEDLKIEETKKCSVIKEEFIVENVTEKPLNKKNKNDSILEKILLNPKSKKKKSKQVKNKSSSESPTEQSWNDYIWKCAICDTQFSSFAELNTHSIQYHKICNAYKCVDCNKRKLRLETFLSHMRQHKDYLRKICFVCDARFPTLYKASTHKSKHNTSDYVCLGCHTEFQSLEEFNAHTSEYYLDRIRKPITPLAKQIIDKNTCLLCNRTFRHRGNLNKHLRVHLKEEKKTEYACDRCGKFFTMKALLTEHLMKHDNIRPFPCKICNKAFITKTQLRIHVGGHENKKPFTCEQCGRSFRLKGQLHTHKKIHLDFLPFVCTVCGKGFRYKANLHHHNLLHSGVKPHLCEICPRAFTNWPNYNKHMTRMHNMDMTKKRQKRDGICPIDPATKEEVYTQTKEVLEWKNELMTRRRGSKCDSLNTDAAEGGNPKLAELS